MALADILQSINHSHVFMVTDRGKSYGRPFDKIKVAFQYVPSIKPQYGHDCEEYCEQVRGNSYTTVQFIGLN